MKYPPHVEFRIDKMAAQLEVGMFCERYGINSHDLRKACKRVTIANPLKKMPEIWHYDRDMKDVL